MKIWQCIKRLWSHKSSQSNDEDVHKAAMLVAISRNEGYDEAIKKGVDVIVAEGETVYRISGKNKVAIGKIPDPDVNLKGKTFVMR